MVSDVNLHPYDSDCSEIDNFGGDSGANNDPGLKESTPGFNKSSTS